MKLTNITNLSKYLIIGIIVALLSSFITYKATIASHKITLQQVQPVMNKAIEKATNEITNKIEVPKIKKSEPVSIIMSPTNEQIAVRDTCMVDLSKLTEGQRKRLDRWLAN